MKHAITIILLTLTLHAAAQNDTDKAKQKKERRVELYGHVVDSFTKAALKAHVTLMTASDSAVVDTTTCWTWGSNSFFQFKVPARQENYILKGSCDGYEDGYLNYDLRHIARNNHFELPRLMLKKKQDIYKEVGLDGVVVTGTRVKIAYRGDTIVYNASAFNLPEGSMLDGLIRQMPGAELKDNGDIYINGRKVDYLMLNGKDFFKGQNKVMLDNLPYFTVKELKVYDKSTKQSERIGHDVEQKDYVMDVQLKREYNRGYMANAETGIGTDDRYMGRLFALYYDDHTRMSLFGNVNNVNENRRPGGEGEWRPANMPQGLRTTKMTGMHLTTEDKDKRWEERFDATMTWDDAENENRTARETFSSEGNIFGNSWSLGRQKDFRFTASNNLEFSKVGIDTDLGISYTNGHRDTESTDSTMRDVLINHLQNLTYNHYRTLNLNGSLSWSKKFEWGDYVSLSVNGSLERQKPSERFSIQDTRYVSNDSRDFRHYYADTHQNSYDYNLNASYTFQMPNNWYISGGTKYNQQRHAIYNSNYRLDWLANATSNELTFLPSSREVLLTVFDADNSDDQHTLTRAVTPSISLSHSTDKAYFSINLPINVTHQKMHFVTNGLDTLATRSYTTFMPNISFYSWGRDFRMVSYSLNVSQPDFASLMPSDDTTNPLAFRENNPNLKATITHQLSTHSTWNNDSLKRFISAGLNVSVVQRSWGTRTTYDASTGAYSYKADNIDGNWNASLNGTFQQPIDHKRRLTLTEGATASYIHSVDFPVAYVALTTQPDKSTVHNWTLSDYLKLEYQLDKLTASVSGNVAWRRSTSTRQDFQNINAFAFDYGVAVNYTIPWVKIQLGTDLRMFSRRGYYSKMMNDDHLVWNAELSRSLLKDRLTMKLTAFDLLRQLSSTQYSVNAQGRTETWNNCIPRYVMFSLNYKLSQKPKK